MAPLKDGGTVSPSWTFCFFDCAAPDRDESERAEHRKSAMRIGVQREMTVLYQQPHLVPPMKLTLYDQMPSTPTPPPPSHLSKVLSQGRNLASRASERASFSMRKRASSRPVISNPIERVPSTRRYRPLELSIYEPQNRLSDLPEFDSDAVEFTDDGAIQLPPRALIKAKSQEFQRTPSQRDLSKSQSMIEPTLLHRRTDTKSTVISTSRPASNYEALRSHPVSWHENSLPGLAPQCHHRNPALAATLLSPMQEEFTPACTPACISIDGTLLEFPKVDPEPRATSPDHEAAPAPEITPQIVSTTMNKKITVAPFKLSRPPTSSSTTARASQQQPSPTIPAHETSPSISSVYSTSTSATSPHWHHRGPSSSAASISTTRSFAEHRRKRSEFYQVRIPKVPGAVNTTSPTRVPSTRIPFTQQFKPSYARSRARTNGSVSTVGSASTVNTDVLSFEDDDAESVTTMSTTHVVQDVRCPSRSARGETVKRALEKHNAVVVREEEVEGEEEVEEVFVQEIGRPMPSPGVGLAF